jgi:cell division protein FtsW
MATPPQPAGTSRARSLVNPAAVLVVCAIGLTILGLTILFSASVSLKKDPYFYLDKQLVGVVAAAVLCFVMSRVNLDYARHYAWWVAGGLVVLLTLVFVPFIGQAAKGSHRWIGYGTTHLLQPSEFAKLALVFCLAHYLALNQTRIGELKRGFLYPLAIIAAFVIPVVREPDYGMAALYLAVGLLMLFLAGAKWRYLVTTVALAAVGFAALVIHNPNRIRRFAEFWNKEPPYQLKQALVAYAAGGVDGAGLGLGRQQLSYLPEAHTDFIFSVVGEELGLWFTLGVVAVFTIVLVAGLVHLRRAPNLFHFLLVAGCLLFITLQATINLLVVTGMVPPKGMSLPFISAGLSNLLLMGLLLGVFVNTQRTWGRAGLPARARAMREVLA